jgi:hypothetical protein
VRTGRFFWFLISIFLGVVVGLVYGWMINPVTYVNTTPDNMRSDYKADYVLMVAEIFQTEQNLPMATRRLDLLGGDSPTKSVQRAILSAQELGYNSRDLEMLGRLSLALQSGSALPAAAATIATTLTTPAVPATAVVATPQPTPTGGQQ